MSAEAKSVAQKLPPNAAVPENVKQLAKEYDARRTDWWFCPNPQRQSIYPLYLSFQEDENAGEWVYFQENEKKQIPANRKKSLRNIYVWNNESEVLQPVTPEMLPPIPEEIPVPQSPSIAFFPSTIAELKRRYKVEQSPYWFCSNPSRAYPIFVGPRDVWINFREEGKFLVNKRRDLCHIYSWDPKEGFQPARPETAPADGVTPEGTKLVEELEKWFACTLNGVEGVVLEDELALAVGIKKRVLKDFRSVDAFPTTKEEKLLRHALKIAQSPIEEKRAAVKEFLSQAVGILKAYESGLKRKSLTPLALPTVEKIAASLDQLPDGKVHMLYWRFDKYGVYAMTEAFLQANNTQKDLAFRIILKMLLFPSMEISDAKNTHKANPGADANNSIWLKGGLRVKKPGEKEDQRIVDTYLFQDGVFLRATHPHTVGVDYIYIKKEKLLEIMLCDKNLPSGLITFDIEREPQDNEDRKIEFVHLKRRIAVKLFHLVKSKDILLFRSLVGSDLLAQDVLGTPVYTIRTKTMDDEPQTEVDNKSENATINDSSVLSLVTVTSNKDGEKEAESLSLTEYFYTYPFFGLEDATEDLTVRLAAANPFFAA